LSRRLRIAVKSAVWLVCLTPVALLAYRFQTDALGANPIDAITRTLGDWTLRLLLASLALTPIRLVFGVSWPVLLRRLLGLFAFAYAVMHFAVWIAIDHFFEWPELLADIAKKPYITVGVAALLLLLPLAATSTTWAIRRLGGRGWSRLHRLVYVAAILGVLHYLWLAKVGVQGPYWYGLILALLLAVRTWSWAMRRQLRRGSRRGVAPPAGVLEG
jgi:sulfoxide reductase heme-binding subunit YedZ